MQELEKILYASLDFKNITLSVSRPYFSIPTFIEHYRQPLGFALLLTAYSYVGYVFGRSLYDALKKTGRKNQSRRQIF